MVPHESVPPSPQSSMEEGGESTPEEGEEHPRAEGAEGEPPLSLVDLLGLVELIVCDIFCILPCIMHLLCDYVFISLKCGLELAIM